MEPIGLLLTNIGTPDKPTTPAVKRYLKKFLSDPRVIEIPQFIWQPLLRSVILPLRSRKSAKLYQKIWTPEGSPLLVNSIELARSMETHFQTLNLTIHVKVGMHYSNPTIADSLNQFRKDNINKIFVLPLFPQYSGTSSGSSFNFVTKALCRWRHVPDVKFIHQYSDHPAYIDAVCASIKDYWATQDQYHLLFSFHGIPNKNVSLGDPYPNHCHDTVAEIVKKLGLNKNDWSISFQSRLGYAKWLSPYTDQVLVDLAKNNIKDINVVCPGFAVDCLETLEEIAIRNKEIFQEAGGNNLQYIPALNASSLHVNALSKIVLDHIQGWT